MDQRILYYERKDGACPVCQRRHKHKDDCEVLKLRKVFLMEPDEAKAAEIQERMKLLIQRGE